MFQTKQLEIWLCPLFGVFLFCWLGGFVCPFEMGLEAANTSNVGNVSLPEVSCMLLQLHVGALEKIDSDQGHVGMHQ